MNFKRKTLLRLARFFGYQVQGLGSEILLSNPAVPDTHKSQEKMRWELFSKKDLIHLLKDLNIDVVLDVGANKGQYAQAIRKAGFRGKIISFEPVQASFDALKKLSESDPDWEVNRLGLGNEKSTLRINVMASDKLSSFLQPNDVASILSGVKNEVVREEEIPVVRLEDFLNDQGPSLKGKRLFLKMDTQGFDLLVFQGIGTWKNQILGLQSEISIIPLYQGMPNWMEAIETYRKGGFSLVGLYPIAWHKTSQEVVEFDCIMKNKA